MTNDRVAELLREIEQLRNALQGRTVSCGQCNMLARQRDDWFDKFVKAAADLKRVKSQLSSLRGRCAEPD